MTQSDTYGQRRGELQEYFDRTAVDAWARLTSDEPVGRIRTTVREGRNRMRDTLLTYLPADLTNQTLLDAGCGTGALAVEAARRGAHVTAIDISPRLVDLARERVGQDELEGSVDFAVADMLDHRLGAYDWIVAMDSFIHYQLDDVVDMVSGLAVRARRGMSFTFAPRTPLLALMHMVGKAFPRGNRSPDIVPIAHQALESRLRDEDRLQGFDIGRSDRIDSTFYTSQTMELVRS